MKTIVENKIDKIRKLIEAEFYPEEHLKFSEKVDSLLSDIEKIGTRVLSLYPEDFKKVHDWVAVCEQLGVNPSSLKVEISVLDAKGVNSE